MVDHIKLNPTYTDPNTSKTTSNKDPVATADVKVDLTETKLVEILLQETKEAAVDNSTMLDEIKLKLQMNNYEIDFDKLSENILMEYEVNKK